MPCYRIIGTILLLSMFWQSISVSYVYAGTSEILKQHDYLKQREKQIVVEMIQVELALDRVDREYNAVQSKLAATRINIPLAQEQLGESETKLKLCQDKLGLWLRHFYIEGRTNYLFILLGAVNFGDFLNRMALVGMLVSRGIIEVNKTREVIADVKQRTAALSNLEQQLVNQEKQLTQTMNQTLTLQQTKQQLLDVTQKELGENQGKVLAVVRGVSDTLKPLETVLLRFRDAPWDKYRPDNMQWLGHKVKAVYSQNTISKLLFGGTNLKYPVKTTFSKNLFIIEGVNQEQVAFSIAGELSVTRGNVCYKLKSITIGDVALSNELVTAVAGDEGLIYPVNLLMGWRLNDIVIDEGKAIFELVQG